jgi:hypothetical protein
MLAAWGVVSDTPGARAAGATVGFAARLGVGTIMIALPPIDCWVAAARGWAAPPPTTGRGANAVGLACATGEGETAAGFVAGPSLEAGVGAGVVQLSISPAIKIVAMTRRRLDPGDTR